MTNIQTSRPNASAISSHITSNNQEAPHLATAAQVQHNLEHQHLWTSLTGYTIPGNTTQTGPLQEPQEPIPLISGYPPHRVYTHPDEQLYMLENKIQEDDLQPERMFVVPTTQGQPWSLRHMAVVFDRLPEFMKQAREDDGSLGVKPADDPEKAEKLAKYYAKKAEAGRTKEWGSQRLLLAMVDKGMGGDATVAYYVVQEGEVKPRQN
jgi:tRNA-splicing endonuclease subunit Sen15